MNRTAFMIALASLGGCASKVEAPVDYSSPVKPTAVFETTIINGGIYGLVPFEVSQKHYVRPDMLRDEQAMRGTGKFTGWMVSALSGDGDVDVVRLDTGKRYVINNPKKEYTECPAHGCPVRENQKPQKEEPSQHQEPKQETQKDCVARIVSNTFDVKDTGATRTINGFNTDGYKVAWVVRMRDPQRRITTSTVSADVWTTRLTEDMRKAFGYERSFYRAYGGGARGSAPRGETGEAKPIPPEVTDMMAAYLSALSPSDRAALTSAGDRLSKIKGYPIQTKIEWRLAGDACAPAGGRGSSASRAGAGAASTIAGLFGKNNKPSADKPILSFTVETKSLKIEAVHDGVFAVPSGYKRTN